MTSVFSLVYILQIFSIASSLALPAFLVIVANCVVGVVTALLQVSVSRKSLDIQAELSGWHFALMNCILKF